MCVATAVFTRFQSTTVPSRRRPPHPRRDTRRSSPEKSVRAHWTFRSRLELWEYWP